MEEGTWLKAETAVSATAAADQTTDRKPKTKRGGFRIGISWEQRRECITQFGGDSSGNACLARDSRVPEGEAELTICWPKTMFCQDLFCSAAKSYSSTRPRYEPPQGSARRDRIPDLENGENWNPARGQQAS